MIKFTIELNVPNRELGSDPVERAKSLLAGACGDYENVEHEDWEVISAEYKVPEEYTKYKPYLVSTGTRHYYIPIQEPGKNYTLCGAYVQHGSLHQNAKFKKECKLCIKKMEKENWKLK